MVSVKFATLLTSLTLASNVFATVFLTNPTAQTTCSGGKECSITWQDDGKKPSLTEFGLASVGVWVGSVNSQSELQHIQDGVNVATTAAIKFTVNPQIGPNSDAYFIRFTSAAAKNPDNAAFPAQSFTAKFKLDSMTGQFNSTIQAQIDGASSAPIPTPSGTSSSSGSSGTAKPTGNSSSSTKPTGSATTNGAAASGTGAAVVGASMNMGTMGAMIGAGLLAAFAL